MQQLDRNPGTSTLRIRTIQENDVDFNNAITAHSKWKMTLSSYIAKPDHSLNASVVGMPNNCELGKWLDGEGRKQLAAPELSKLVSEHTRFHKAAAEVIRKADAGRNVAEEIALGTNSEFASASASIVRELMNLKAKQI